MTAAVYTGAEDSPDGAPERNAAAWQRSIVTARVATSGHVARSLGLWESIAVAGAPRLDGGG
jgi:hypothetical protein